MVKRRNKTKRGKGGRVFLSPTQYEEANKNEKAKGELLQKDSVEKSPPKKFKKNPAQQKEVRRKQRKEERGKSKEKKKERKKDKENAKKENVEFSVFALSFYFMYFAIY